MATDLFLGIDDTDGPGGMCTTYLMSRIVESLSGKFSGFPRLVRLNPNISYRTRGNGALSIRLGTGHKKTKIGYVGETPVETNVHEKKVHIDDHELETLWEQVKSLADKDQNTNPGMVLGEQDNSGTFYKRAIKGELPLVESIEEIEKVGNRTWHLGNGRGIIGSYASISWPGTRNTFEVIAHNYPRGNQMEKSKMIEIASYVESYDFTFNSMDFRNSHPSIFPNQRTPVVYGIRGMDPNKLLELAEDINDRFNLDPERFMVFNTNQGTDDHIEKFKGTLSELSSYRIRGRVLKKPRIIEGGHYFSEISSESVNTNIAAFEPTKEFRNIFSRLVPGDLIEIYGSYINRTLNVEKMRIIALAYSYTRVPPRCNICGSTMKTRGKFDYRCVKCGNTSLIPAYRENLRDLKPGFYEVPVCARRHLSAPLKLMKEIARQ